MPGMRQWTPRLRAGIVPDMRALVPLLLLAACSSTTTAADGRWFGTATPDPARPGCAASRPSLIVIRGAALFTPDEGTVTLQGKIGPDGSLTAERTGIGANKQPYISQFTAKPSESGWTGTYTTPRCAFAVVLSAR